MTHHRGHAGHVGCRPGGLIARLRPPADFVVVQRVTAAARQMGVERLKPIYLALGETVPYDDIRLVLAYLQSRAQTPAPPAG